MLTNDRAADVHVAGVRASCGCTTPRIEKEWLKSYEQGAIVAHLNSSNYLGHRSATITVTFDQPAYAEVQLQVRAFVHDNVLMEPSSVELGAVEQGQAAEGHVRLYRADLPNWQILGVQIADPQLSGQVVELARRGSEVWYDLRVRLAATAPAGYISEYAVLTTNDPSAAQIPVLVEGQVQPKVVVSPASLFLGVVRPGEKVTKQLVVRANTPFRITAIRGDAASLTLPQPDTQAKLLHLVPVTFVAGRSGARWSRRSTSKPTWRTLRSRPRATPSSRPRSKARLTRGGAEPGKEARSRARQGTVWRGLLARSPLPSGDG